MIDYDTEIMECDSCEKTLDINKGEEYIEIESCVYPYSRDVLKTLCRECWNDIVRKTIE
jgi:hypothetical protein